MKKKVFSGAVPAKLALSLCAAIALSGCAHPESGEYTQAQSNVPSPLTDLDNEKGAAAPNTAQPAVDQQALDALNAMGAYLRTLRKFEVDADTSTDVVLDNGQNAALLRHTMLKVKRPDRLRADITGNGNVRGLIYDGREFMTFNEKKGYYTRNDAAPTLDGLVRELANTWRIEAPLAELFYWGNGKDDNTAITAAQALGVEKLDTRWCTHYAFQQRGADWEMWIEQGRRPLPCHLVVTDTTQASRPRHEVTYHWNLAPSFVASTFALHPKPGAKRIELEPAAARPSFEEAQ
ncbi:DUF2092 domain-containing protein [Paraburkholderia sp. CNPSo 3281]|uniref:DUF2092 domain-containing protein n=1 Tax=Paraburkholderia sp. CNPSo 3281 TaxID=2940933 RepID=UPI0020B7D9FC|nr:DUF2092 domain-containing protein [Paraburkholderia sp. CNPSo 3281]MCP3714597.1 DUF2092 domain-containing protein [Paraburkholderia sp. CNPSo 3281]